MQGVEIIWEVPDGEEDDAWQEWLKEPDLAEEGEAEEGAHLNKNLSLLDRLKALKEKEDRDNRRLSTGGITDNHDPVEFDKESIRFKAVLLSFWAYFRSLFLHRPSPHFFGHHTIRQVVWSLSELNPETGTFTAKVPARVHRSPREPRGRCSPCLSFPSVRPSF